MQTQDIYEVWRDKTRAEGKAEGRADGERTVLRRQLSKFGPLSVETEARLGSATEEELILWAERILEARSLDDVFR